MEEKAGSPKRFIEETIDRGSIIFSKEDLKSIYACIQCGTCSGSCPSGRRTNLRIRSLVRKIQKGYRDEVLGSEDLWLCTTCYTCQERCPRKVMITDIVRIVRNIAFEAGHAKPRHLDVARMLMETGHAISLTGEVEEVRVKLGLEARPPTSLKFKDVLDELDIIMEKDSFKMKVVGKKDE